MSAGFPAGAFNVVTGCDMTLGAKVAQNASISYVTYSGNKQVCTCEKNTFLIRVNMTKMTQIMPSVFSL